MSATLLRFLILGFVIASAPLFVGCGGSSPTTPPTVDQGGTPKARADNKPAFDGNSDDFVKECMTDEKAAEKKYEGKLIIVEGTVLEAKKLLIGESWSVNLYGVPREGKTERDGEYCDCQFEPSSPSYAKAQTAKKDQKIKMKGKFYGIFPYGARLTGCEIVDGPKQRRGLGVA